MIDLIKGFDWQPPRPGRGAIAVWRRNLLVWRKLIGAAVFMNFGEPVVYLLGLGVGLGFFIQEMEGVAYLTFLATGIIASSTMQTASFEAMYSAYTRMVPQNTYEAMLSTPLTLDEILAGEMLWCATKALFSGVAILLVATLLGAVSSWQALWIVPITFLAGIAFAGPALVMCAISPGYDFFSYYQTIILTPMFILCGVFYPVESLPASLQEVVYLLPLTHLVELVRPLAYGGTIEQPLLNATVLLFYAIAGFYLAVVLARKRLLI
jgi:lipooligosaccharide transport system permease protein